MAKYELDLTDMQESERVALFDIMLSSFESARNHAGIIEHYYQIGDGIVCMRFAGPALVDWVTKAFAHLRVEPTDSADLTIRLFDSQSTQTRLPFFMRQWVRELLWHWDKLIDHRSRVITGFEASRIRAAFHPGPGFIRLFDTCTDQAVLWIQDAANFPDFEHAYPLSNILNWWAQSRQQLLVHSAVIGSADNGILLTNKGGSGKSTTTIASALAGLQIVSDDYCLVTDDTEGFRAHSLYNSTKIKHLPDLQRFPQLKPHIVNWNNFESGQNNAVIFIEDALPNRMAQSLALQAILVPTLTHQPVTTITPLSRAVAMRALAPSTMFQLAGNEKPTFQQISQMVRRLPCYSLNLGTEIAAIPPMLRQFIHELQSQPVTV